MGPIETLHLRALVRRLLFGIAGVVAVAAMATAAAAQVAEDGGGGGDEGPQIVLTGRADVRADERAEAVVILDGPANIEGQVEEAVVALNGDIRVSGTVGEDVVALNGRAIVESGAHVRGDVVSSRAPRVAPDATVDGETRAVRFQFRALGVFLWVAWWVAITVSVLALGLILLAVAPAMMAAALAVARGEGGPSIGWGLLLAVGLPLASVLVMFTVVGIPLGLLGLLTLALFFTLGYVVAALFVGRLLVKEPTSRYLAFLAGLAILRLVGVIPGIGGLVTFVACAYGLGALAIAAWRARRAPAPVVPGPAAA